VEISTCEVSWATSDPDTSVVRILKLGAEWIQDFLLLSDVHFDSPYCNRRLLKVLLDEAVEKKAPIIIFGDWYDAMQSRDDPRRTKDELMAEYKDSQYLDRLVVSSCEFLEPYKDNIVLIAEGNHDSKIREKLETDLIWRLTKELDVMHMGYAGYVLFLFSNKSSGSHRSRKELFYHHGSGGGGIVTRGTMRAQREAAWALADIYVGGHIHESWRMEGERLRLTNSGKPIITDMLHICIPALKKDFQLRSGYHIEKGRPPKPLGGFWLHFYHNPRKHGKVGIDALKAE
jgi:predicted phosphodiesterase